MKKLIPCKAAFATVAPNALNAFGKEFQIALPHGVQVCAYQSSTNIRPRGLRDDQLVCEQDLSVEGHVSFDVVVRVDEDRELAEAVAKDVETRLLALGYAVCIWSCAFANHRYAYAYIRAVEKSHEQRRDVPV